MASSLFSSLMGSRDEAPVPSPWSNCSAAAHSFGSKLPKKQLQAGSIPAAIMSSPLWRTLAAKCGHVQEVCESKDVTVLCCTLCLPGTAGKDSSALGEEVEVAVKLIPEERAAPNIRQVEAEALACTMLPCNPVLAKQIAIPDDQGKHVTMIGPYAVDSVEELLGRRWVCLNIHIRIALARDMLACMLIALHVMRQLPEPQMYRASVEGFKVANICYDAKTRLFRLIDFGLMTPLSKRNFFAATTPVYLDPQLAREHQGAFAWCTEEGQAAFTTALDIYTLCLAALQLILRVLSPTLHYYLHESSKSECPMSDFLQALAGWDPTACAELMQVSDEQCKATIGLSFNPEDRFAASVDSRSF